MLIYSTLFYVQVSSLVLSVMGCPLAISMVGGSGRDIRTVTGGVAIRTPSNFPFPDDQQEGQVPV